MNYTLEPYSSLSPIMYPAVLLLFGSAADLFCLNRQHIKEIMKINPIVELTSMGTRIPAE